MPRSFTTSSSASSPGRRSPPSPPAHMASHPAHVSAHSAHHVHSSPHLHLHHHLLAHRRVHVHEPAAVLTRGLTWNSSPPPSVRGLPGGQGRMRRRGLRHLRRKFHVNVSPVDPLVWQLLVAHRRGASGVSRGGAVVEIDADDPFGFTIQDVRRERQALHRTVLLAVLLDLDVRRPP